MAAAHILMLSLAVAVIFTQPPQIIEYRNPTPVHARKVAGRVLDPSAAGVPDVEVQVCEEDWKHCVTTILTDSKGRFSVRSAGRKELFLRFWEFGFNAQCVRVVLDHKAKLPIEINFNLST
jgi:hypothetical protein